MPGLFKRVWDAITSSPVSSPRSDPDVPGGEGGARSSRQKGDVTRDTIQRRGRGPEKKSSRKRKRSKPAKNEEESRNKKRKRSKNKKPQRDERTVKQQVEPVEPQGIDSSVFVQPLDDGAGMDVDTNEVGDKEDTVQKIVNIEPAAGPTPVAQDDKVQETGTLEDQPPSTTQPRGLLDSSKPAKKTSTAPKNFHITQSELWIYKTIHEITGKTSLERVESMLSQEWDRVEKDENKNSKRPSQSHFLSNHVDFTVPEFDLPDAQHIYPVAETVKAMCSKKVRNKEQV